MRYIAVKLLVILCFVAPSAWADNLVSIKPLAMIHQALSPATPVDILIPSQQNMHDYALSMTDLRKLQKSSTIIYLGDDSEHAITKIKQKFPKKSWHAVAENSDHAWLDPIDNKVLINNVLNVLKQQLPEQSEQLEQQHVILLKALDEWQQHWAEKFQPYQGHAVLLGHTAIAKLLENFGLKPVMYFTSHSHGQQQSGAKQLLQIQLAIQQGAVLCAIEEPEVSFKQLQQRFPQLGTQFIDPNGSNIALSSQAYIELLHSITNAVYQCIQTKEM